MNILITGAEGFIGRNVCESFISQKYNLYTPSMTELDLQDENRVQDEKKVRDYIVFNKIDVVIHAAAKPGHRNAPDPAGIFFYNTRMFFSIARNIDYIEKLIIIGSGAVYDQRCYKDRMTEDYADYNLPIDEHGLCKYVINKSLSGFHNKVIDLRVFGIFGKYEDYAIRFISNMCCKALFDMNLTMNQNRIFSYLYVDDLMPVLDYFIENKSLYNCYNVVPDDTYGLYTLAQKVLEVSGKRLDIIVNKEGTGSSYTGDNSRIRSEINRLNFTEIDKSIQSLYKWYHDNKSMLNRDLLVTDK